MVRKYGWRPDKPDFRDHICDLSHFPHVELVKTVDLRTTGHLPPVYDQGQTSSCTGNAIAGAIQYGLKAQSKPDHIPSRLFIYYNERVMEGTTNSDAGAEIRDGIKSVANDGAPDEKIWPFVFENLLVRPSDEAYAQAKTGIIKQYARVPVLLRNIQNVLSHGIPIVFGVTLYNSFESDQVAQTGIVPMPSPTESVVGGHAMLIVGYNETHFIVRNSWGEGWGDKGYCYMPIEYITNVNLADDFWAIFLA